MTTMRRDTFSLPEVAPAGALRARGSLDRVPLGESFVVQRVLPDPKAPSDVAGKLRDKPMDDPDAFRDVRGFGR